MYILHYTKTLFRIVFLKKLFTHCFFKIKYHQCFVEEVENTRGAKYVRLL